MSCIVCRRALGVDPHNVHTFALCRHRAHASCLLKWRLAHRKPNVCPLCTRGSSGFVADPMQAFWAMVRDRSAELQKLRVSVLQELAIADILHLHAIPLLQSKVEAQATILAGLQTRVADHERQVEHMEGQRADVNMSRVFCAYEHKRLRMQDTQAEKLQAQIAQLQADADARCLEVRVAADAARQQERAAQALRDECTELQARVRCEMHRVFGVPWGDALRTWAHGVCPGCGYEGPCAACQQGDPVDVVLRYLGHAGISREGLRELRQYYALRPDVLQTHRASFE